jgi:hypothetical protein
MYLTADKVTLDDDEGRFTLEVEDDEGRTYRFIIHHIDLNAFYDQVKGQLGPYLNEMHAARTAVAAGVTLNAFLCRPEDIDESGGYAADDPKHPTFHDRMADVWDMRGEK